MRMFSILVLAALASIQMFAAEKKSKLTPEQIERRKAEYFGGHVIQPVKTKNIVLVDETKKVDTSLLKTVSTDITKALGYVCQVGEAVDAGVVLKVVECNKTGPLCVMPDDGLVLVNLKALSLDKPESAVLNRRLTKELWRGFVYVLGGGNSLYANCVMKPVSSLKELDAVSSLSASPEVFSRMRDGAANRGIKAPRCTTYRQACREGWAPAPTNSIQKAIWDKIHELPTAPIKIAPESKKVKD